MEEMKPVIENTEHLPELVSILKTLSRPAPFPGMEGEMLEDPIAREIMAVGTETLTQAGIFLEQNGIHTLSPLESGYGFSSVVLDAGDTVVRLSRMAPTKKPDAPHVLQPVAAEIIGGLSIQISKKLDTYAITEDDVKKVQDDLSEEGYVWDDAGTDNLGRDENNGLFIIDGSVSKKPA